MFGEYLARWIQSYRDLPLRLNQWANVVRWELRPRLFLRTSEFLWQEGHTAHTTRDDAAAYARRIHADVYRSVLEEVLAIPVLTGLKTAAERFAGATSTLTCEGMMRDGKALQLATSHELGQNFARAFDITYTDEDGSLQVCWTTSWGSSTRMVGGVIMTHGDDAGLRLPPKVAPVQVIIVIVKRDPDVSAAAENLERELAATGLRVRVDERTDLGLGRRLTDWELKGVPVRVEIGPRELAQGTVSIARRDASDRERVKIGDAATAASDGVQRGPRGAVRPGSAGARVRDCGRRRSRRRDRGGAVRICSAALGRLRPGGRAAAQRCGAFGAVPDCRRWIGPRGR